MWSFLMTMQQIIASQKELYGSPKFARNTGTGSGNTQKTSRYRHQRTGAEDIAIYGQAG